MGDIGNYYGGLLRGYQEFRLQLVEQAQYNYQYPPLLSLFLGWRTTSYLDVARVFGTSKKGPGHWR